ncbi:CUB and EGF-like domain-containing protein 3 [Durusdinium trenchii]|uniref:CUB and EGF-like domain-containing protein 3 n=1 Tax=Durusdinium trenchii TaxID=1381693 RepID=A0ABP0Q9Y3_9DINO
MMKQYLQVTGDDDGVIIQGNGDVHGRCFDGHFWRSPACRNNASACLVHLTAGSGWGGDEFMMKATAFSTPIAWAVAKTWGDYTTIPKDLNVSFFWWTPDPTFLRLTPVGIQFPPHDAKAWSINDKTSQAVELSIDKYISKDLASLAPDIEEFLKAFLLGIKDIDGMMLKRMNFDLTHFDAACDWLHANNMTWQKWLPDKTECFERFGLYNERQDAHVESRSDPTDLVCRACPPGTSSQKLEDTDGTTFICRPCPAGTYQVSGASLSCDACPYGEYQDEIGSISCKRCGFGVYQNATGQSSCIPCPVGTTTLGFLAQSINDCGCKADTINILPAASSNFECQGCGEGLHCPFSSSVDSLTQGEALLGEDYVPQVLEGYVSSLDEPLEIFKCQPASFCSGGKPGACAGGLSGMPCASCDAGKAWSGTKCEECGANVVLWAVGTPVAAAGLIGAYYFVNSDIMAKATAFQACLMAAGITVNACQSIAIFGMMTVQWTPNFESTSSSLSAFVLDVEILGVACVTGPSNFLRFLSSASAFPVASLVLVACWAVTKSWSKICKCKKLQVTPWRFYKTANTVGVFLQVGFSALGALALQPLMCYHHPNDQYSLLKYPDTFCGSDEHGAMLGVGIAMLTVYVVGFFVYCCFGAWKLPSWSSNDRSELVKAFLFLIGKFRLDVWWFGLLLLIRGLGFSLAIVLATDSPQLQVASPASSRPSTSSS